MHTFKKRYRSENYGYLRDQIEEYQANNKQEIVEEDEKNQGDYKIG